MPQPIIGVGHLSAIGLILMAVRCLSLLNSASQQGDPQAMRSRESAIKELSPMRQ